MTSAADLIALQDIDLRRDARRAQLADVEARLGETEELIAAREGLAAAESALEALRRHQRDLDGQLQDLDAKIQPLETKLYGGSVRNPKELSDIQREVESLKKHRGVLDDEGLALLESVEAATAAVAVAEDLLKRTQAYWEADQEELEAEKTHAEGDIAHLEAERNLWAKDMDAPTIGLYERLRIAKQGRAVARVQRTSCGGCRISLPSHLVQRLRTGNVLVQCPSCERILVSAQT